MKTRILTGVVAIPLLIILLVITASTTSMIINVFFAAVTAVGIFEFLGAVKLRHKLEISLPSILFGFLLPISGGLVGYIIPTVFYTLYMLCCMVICHKKISFIDFSITHAMTLIISFSLSFIGNVSYERPMLSVFYFCFIIALPWLSDAGAYFIGSAFGKHKLCPEISPKKTIEGAIGGVVIGTILTCFMTFLFEKCFFPILPDTQNTAFNYVTVAVISLLGSILSIFGDLSFSLIKRHYKIKDFGNILPGHGGVLDRFDSVIFVSPLIYIMGHYCYNLLFTSNGLPNIVLSL